MTIFSSECLFEIPKGFSSAPPAAIPEPVISDDEDEPLVSRPRRIIRLNRGHGRPSTSTAGSSTQGVKIYVIVVDRALI